MTNKIYINYFYNLLCIYIIIMSIRVFLYYLLNFNN